MFKKRTNAKAYAAAKNEFKASASKASSLKAETETGSFHKDPAPPGDSTKTNLAFVDYNTTANQQSDQEFPELSYEFCAENTNSLKGSFKSGHLTVSFETRSSLPPLELTKAYSEDYLIEYVEYLNYEYSTVTIRNDEKTLCLLYLPLAEEITPGVYRCKYSDGQIIDYYYSIGFVQFILEAIQACLAIPSIGPKIVEIPDKKRNIKKKAQKAKATSCSEKGQGAVNKATSCSKKGQGAVNKGEKKEKKEKKETKKMKEKASKAKKKNVKRTHSSDIDVANILKGSAHTNYRFTRSMSKC